MRLLERRPFLYPKEFVLKRFVYLSALLTSLALALGLATLLPRISGADLQALRLCDPATHARLLAQIPATDNPWWERLRRDPRLVVYTAAEMPKAYQYLAADRLAGVHDAANNIAADPRPQFDGRLSGTPAHEFPWRTPFGLDEATGWSQFKLFWLPPGSTVRYWGERLPRDANTAWRWQFPAGTVFGEVLLVHDSQGQGQPFELRLRRRQEDGSWQPDVYRPFRTRAELDAAVAATADRGARVFLSHQERPRWDLADHSHTTQRVIHTSALLDHLYPLEEETVRQLLARPFRSVRGHEWIDGGHAPTGRAAYHIVPRGYAGGLVPVTTATCASCHKTTLAHQDDFDGRGGWYGRVPGDDQVFSWHPFEPASVSRTGFPQPVRLREAFVRAGIVRPWNER